MTSSENVLGPRIGDATYDSEQQDGGRAIIWHYLRGSCPITTDPQKAQIFIIPLIFPDYNDFSYVHDTPGKVYEFMPPRAEARLKSVCERFTQSEWLINNMEYLNDYTVRKHVVIPLEFFDFMGFCKGAIPNFVDKVSSRTKKYMNDMPWLTNNLVHSNTKGVIDVPLVSSVHVDMNEGRPPWYQVHTRPQLMAFTASLEGRPDAKRIREFLHDKCVQYGEGTCNLVSSYSMTQQVGIAMQAKSQSTFCLEPPGFGDHRKSQIDSLLLGCIPVIFTPHTDNSLWPTFWGSWRNESRVLLDAVDLLRGKTDLLKTLQGIPESKVKQMQTSIAQNAHRFHIPSVPSIKHDDAIKIVTNRVAQWSHSVRP